MLLSNLFSIPENRNVDILMERGRIISVSECDSSANTSREPALKFDNAIVFPGLINSHDHLDFNSFPQLGNRIYNNYVEWGLNIHQKNKDVINNVLKIPGQLRTQWGIYKNLLNGITTVVNHGPKLVVEDDLITIMQNSHVLHSVANEKKWRLKLNMPFIKKEPFSIHVGEGTDESAQEEITALLKWNLFNRELIGIHAVAMDEEQAGKFKAIVWCPDSNNFLLGRTAQIDKLKHQTKILFGTDSTVSANWNLWSHLRTAKDTKMVTDEEVFEMLTGAPAKVWGLSSSSAITIGHNADIVIAKKKPELKGMDAFFTLNPEDILVVMHKGCIRLFDEELCQQFFEQGINVEGFFKIYINNKCKYIFGNLPELIKSIRKHYPEAHFPITY
ncbi:MAG TPA: amidohydrolase family protein [Bacteroidia bacterium]|nr:amidohydrolase family protein [Bacteroidia bacterium]